MFEGKFIVLEGIDGCGKTTIAKLLARRLKAVITKEPTNSSTAGKTIHKILQHRAQAPSPLELQKLYIADRLEHIEKIIKPALANGKIVICQRYALSTFAYGVAFGVPLNKLKHNFLKPDITILLDLPTKEAMKRIAIRKKSREYFEKEKYLAKVQKAYLTLVKKYNAVIVNARPTPSVIAKEILGILEI